ncbi:hypothetical protein GpartN1_g5944.t1 [Galdieria partita]|uniref:VTT domain-containing protein n=1 Tax=Galdieria partita TaxID=83374 RepID=A0A9C7USS8_9RHOD|nr:hypothetical protein GpartN1_g5944.t1 [Galdieria partita]
MEKNSHLCGFQRQIVVSTTHQHTHRYYWKNGNRKYTSCSIHNLYVGGCNRRLCSHSITQLVCKKEEKPLYDLFFRQQFSNSNKKYSKGIKIGIAILLLLLLGYLIYLATTLYDNNNHLHHSHNNIGWLIILPRFDMKSSLQCIPSLELPIRFMLFFFIHTIAVIGCFPGTVAIELAAGASMNIYYALICMYTSKVLAAMVSFLLAKSILYRWTRKKLEQYPQAQKWMSAIAQQGWRIALFSRLSPIPSFINNYLIALSPISFRDYMIATILGIIPFLFQVVVLGAGIQNMKQHHLSWITILKYIAVIVGILGLSYYTKKIFDSFMQESDSSS